MVGSFLKTAKEMTPPEVLVGCAQEIFPASHLHGMFLAYTSSRLPVVGIIRSFLLQFLDVGLLRFSAEPNLSAFRERL